MGWKTLKNAYGIKHTVQVTERGILIGSDYVPDILIVDPKTGVITESSTFSGFMKTHCPNLLEAKPADVLKAIEAADVFDKSIEVFTFDGSDIISAQCEAPGYPNVTHDGTLMYDNTHSIDKAEVVRWAKESASRSIEHIKHSIAGLERDLVKQQSALIQRELELENLRGKFGRD